MIEITIKSEKKAFITKNSKLVRQMDYLIAKRLALYGKINCTGGNWGNGDKHYNLIKV